MLSSLKLVAKTLLDGLIIFVTFVMVLAVIAGFFYVFWPGFQGMNEAG